ncbi:DUF2786 domain-containing protein [Streptacidiphilus sp. MAP5-3]|uniref:DUF2786 domain-containing protein n=1 Tax=unclassified Streptacidiphilus TaxID=2643834 RepID=UPI0035135191
MTDQANAKLATIRALLARAEHPTTPEAEAELARNRAFAMMAKYGIEQAMVDAAKGTGTPTDRRITCEAPWAMERASLVNVIARALDCKAIFMPRGSGSGRVLHVFGYAGDLDRVELLYTSLLLQMASGLAAQHVPAGQGVRAWRRSWQLGFVGRVGRRLEEAERGAREEARGETTATGRSVALVLADRQSAVESAFRTAYPRVRTSRTTMTGNGYGSGWAAGGSADIGGRRIGRSAARVLSA